MIYPYKRRERYRPIDLSAGVSDFCESVAFNTGLQSSCLQPSKHQFSMALDTLSALSAPNTAHRLNEVRDWQTASTPVLLAALDFVSCDNLRTASITRGEKQRGGWDAWLSWRQALLICSCVQVKLLEYLKGSVEDFPSVFQLEIQQFSHGQSNPTYMLRASPL